MNTPISLLMTAPAITVRADDTLTTVAEVLARHKLSFVPVCEGPGGPALGIISASDVLHFKSSGGDMDELKAWQICTYKPLSVAPDASIAQVAKLMLERQVHHLLVMRGQELVGVVSSLDFVKHYLAEAGANPGQAGIKQGEQHA